MFKQTCVRFTAVVVALVLSGCGQTTTPAIKKEAEIKPEPTEVVGKYRLNKIELPIAKSLRTKKGLRAANGTVVVEIVEIEDGAATVFGASRVRARDIISGSWQSFYFNPALNLTNGKKYAIRVRGAGYDTTGLYWRMNASDDGVDKYPAGSSSFPPPTTKDFGFKTYSNDTLDQQQPAGDIDYPITFPDYLWQEFVAGDRNH